MDEAAKNIPTSKFRKHLRPYWNDRMNALKRDKTESYSTWVRANKPRDPNNPLWRSYKNAKKVFATELKTLSKKYDDEQIAHAVRAAEVDRGLFWRLVKKSRKVNGNKISAIKNSEGKIVNVIDSILDTWKSHFKNYYTPKDSPDFDTEHFKNVSDRVTQLNLMTDDDCFLNLPFSEAEVKKAIGTLHKRKACGYDGISSKHLQYGEPAIVRALTSVYNHFVRLEYITTNLGRGIQIPLFKGKGTCCLDPDNYRGISLLTNFNKVYEVLIQGRIKAWWIEHKVISDLQGAGKKKLSCVDTQRSFCKNLSQMPWKVTAMFSLLSWTYPKRTTLCGRMA